MFRRAEIQFDYRYLDLNHPVVVPTALLSALTGCERNLKTADRWCRYAQPPANGWDSSGDGILEAAPGTDH
jgi:hypothetical protein